MRKAEIKRETKETSIEIKVKVDGTGRLTGNNPIGFFDHMMQHLAKYSMMDLHINLTGDLHIDAHHSVEDTAIVLGETLKNAIGDKKGIYRYGHFTLPMDETLTTVALDLSGRPYFKYSGPDLSTMGHFNGYDSELTIEFLEKLSQRAEMNLHILVHYGQNRHHIHESIFKAVGWALRRAVSIDEKRGNDIPSTKGTINE